MRKPVRITGENEFRAYGIDTQLRFALVSDLHNTGFDDLMPQLETADAVLVNGDLVDRHSRGCGFDMALKFLNTVTEIKPVFYSFGNHELKLPEREAYMRELSGTGATLLDDADTEFGGILIGGLTGRIDGGADTDFLDRFEKKTGYKLLLCHQPEIWDRYVRNRAIDLTLCGHAHGGQIRVCGQGLFSPGQGLFPKYTRGLYDGGKMLISAGLSNNTVVPRIFNPCEFRIVTLKPDML